MNLLILRLVILLKAIIGEIRILLGSEVIMRIAKIGTHRRFIYIVAEHRVLGHRCGYVRIPSDHALHGKSYNDKVAIAGIGQDVDVQLDLLFNNVHGGLTFGDELSVFNINGWWLGFDCGHIGDLADCDIATNKELCKEINKMRQIEGGEVRTQEYVEENCKQLVDQIVALQNIFDGGTHHLEPGFNEGGELLEVSLVPDDPNDNEGDIK